MSHHDLPTLSLSSIEEATTGLWHLTPTDNHRVVSLVAGEPHEPERVLATVIPSDMAHPSDLKLIVASRSLGELVREAVLYEATAFAGDAPVSGADLVDWFARWRETSRAVLETFGLVPEPEPEPVPSSS